MCKKKKSNILLTICQINLKVIYCFQYCIHSLFLLPPCGHKLCLTLLTNKTHLYFGKQSQCSFISTLGWNDWDTLLCSGLRHKRSHIDQWHSSSCSTVPSLPPSLFCLSSLRALRQASCSPASGGPSRWAGPSGVCPSGCRRGHGPSPPPLSLPPPPPQELSAVWSGAPRIPPWSASVDPCPPLPPSCPVQLVLGQVGRYRSQSNFASTVVRCLFFFFRPGFLPVHLSFLLSYVQCASHALKSFFCILKVTVNPQSSLMWHLLNLWVELSYEKDLINAVGFD